MSAENSEGKSIGRRSFIVAVGAAWTALVGLLALPVYRYLKPREGSDPFGEEGKAEVKNITLDDVAEPGAGANGGYSGRGVIVYRSEAGELKALDAQCTHAGCIAKYERDKIICHCHGGIYDLNGKNVSGPPPRPLTPLKVVEEGGSLFVMKLNN